MDHLFPNTSRLFANRQILGRQRISGGSLRLGGPASCRDRNIRALDGGLHKFVHERTARKPLTPKPIVKLTRFNDLCWEGGDEEGPDQEF